MARCETLAVGCRNRQDDQVLIAGQIQRLSIGRDGSDSLGIAQSGFPLAAAREHQRIECDVGGRNDIGRRVSVAKPRSNLFVSRERLAGRSMGVEFVLN